MARRCMMQTACLCCCVREIALSEILFQYASCTQVGAAAKTAGLANAASSVVALLILINGARQSLTCWRLSAWLRLMALPFCSHH